MQKVTERVAINLKMLRKKNGLTQKKLAEILGISEKSISKWELGLSLPPSILLPDLSSALGVSINTLFDSGIIKYYLGIDGGGTKTEFLIIDTNGKAINHLVLGPSNPVDIGIENCYKILEKGINDVCGGISKSEISLFAGLAGGNSGNYRQNINAFLSRMGFGRIANGSDTENAIETALQEKDGIAVIMGTGIIGFSQKSGIRRRIGGWGYLLDSGGSGYNLGRDALEASLKFLDGRGKETVLLSLIEKKLDKPLPDAIPEIYVRGKPFIAQFARLVFKAIDMGDDTALEILNKNLTATAEIIRVGLCHTGQNVPVVICGGIAKQKRYLQPFFEKVMPDINITYCDTPIVNGATELAKKELSK